MRHCVEALQRGLCAITATRRLARALRQAHEQACLEAGATVWRTPAVWPLTAWLERRWAQAREHVPQRLPLLLQAEQELAVWEEVVARRAPLLMRRRAAAEEARRAWALLHGFGLGRRDLREPLDADARAFSLWSGDYVSRCADGGWIEPARALPRLAALIAAGELTEPWPGYVLAGFDRPSPSLDALAGAFGAAGLEVIRAAPAVPDWPAPGARRVACADPDAELLLAARWARRRIAGARRVDAARRTASTPPRPTAIVVPDLGRRREAVVRAMEQVLDPPARRPGGARGAPVFELSLGTPLAAAPPVAAALQLLQLAAAPLAVAEVGALLRSPYLPWGGAHEHARARLDVALRRLGEPAVGLSQILRQARMLGAHDAPAGAAVAAVLERVVEQGPRDGARARAGAWAAHFVALLEAAGWPQGRTLNSVEHQQVQAFGSLMADLARQAPMTGGMRLGEACGRLVALARARVHQPASGLEEGVAEAPVQVLGVLEAGGLEFDAVWVCGLDSSRWPPEPAPSPLLPLRLQRQAGMPGADPGQVLAAASAAVRALAGCAPEAVFSFALSVEGESTGPSAAIAELEPVAIEALLAGEPDGGWVHPWRQVRDAAPVPQAIADHSGPVLAPGELVRGGAGALADQAACPFRAFAVHRLGSQSVQAPQSAADPRVRGQLLHRALEGVWAGLSGRADLARLDDAALRRRIAAAVRSALRAEAGLRPETFGPALLELETARLAARVERWLRLELERPDFEVVSREAMSTVELGGVPVRVRPDRIDRLAGGGLLLLDYKTGRTSLSRWFGERPDDPQLPVYATAIGALVEAMEDAGGEAGDEAGDEAGGGAGDRAGDTPAGGSPAAAGPIAAIAYGGLAPDDFGFKGLARDAGIAPGIAAFSPGGGGARASTWPEQLASWKSVAEALGQALAAGEARVSPKRAASCRHCEQPLLCRIRDGADGPEPGS